jgi:hypothetical protein
VNWLIDSLLLALFGDALSQAIVLAIVLAVGPVTVNVWRRFRR